MVDRPYVIIGNWKMHKTIDEARTFVKELLSFIKPSDNEIVGLAAPFTLIHPLSEDAKDSPLLIGAQNMNDASEGSFTGEIAGTMLVDAGAQFVLLGHSERRLLYGETNEWINRKVKRAVEVGLQPVLCIGETKDEYNDKKTHEVIESQLKEGLKDLDESTLQKLIIAYEPVWAIGSGNSADPPLVQEVQLFCRQMLGTIFSEEFASNVVIQYGGAVNPTNAQELLALPDVDGLLIGGASLSLDSFRQIINDRYSKIQSVG